MTLHTEIFPAFREEDCQPTGIMPQWVHWMTLKEESRRPLWGPSQLPCLHVALDTSPSIWDSISLSRCEMGNILKQGWRQVLLYKLDATMKIIAGPCAWRFCCRTGFNEISHVPWLPCLVSMGTCGVRVTREVKAVPLRTHLCARCIIHFILF